MVYKIQNHWISGHCQSSGILNAKKHNVLETGLRSGILDDGQCSESR
jgi:hypothetical protein